MAMPTWCAGPHRNRAVSVRVETEQACAVPWLAAEAPSP
jgi:hypothetical protein